MRVHLGFDCGLTPQGCSAPGQGVDDLPHDPQRVRVVLGQVVGHADTREWTSPPPSSSAVTTSPVAAFTSGGPPRKIVP